MGVLNDQRAICKMDIEGKKRKMETILQLFRLLNCEEEKTVEGF